MSEKKPQFWLDDDPAPHRSRKSDSSQRRPQRYSAVPSGRRPIDSLAPRPISRITPSLPKPPDADKVIHVKLSVPKLPTFLRLTTYIKILKILFKNTKFRSATVIVVVVAGALITKGIISKPSNNGSATNGQSSTELAKNSGINPLLPAGQTGQSQTKTLNSTFDKSKQLFSYEDSYQGANFTVSEQPLPQALKSDETAFKTAAEAIGAKRSLDTAKGTVYVGTLPKQTVQLAVLKTKTQLVFIRSSTELEDYFWVKYIDNLKFSS